jgi:hypothetical protein
MRGRERGFQSEYQPKGFGDYSHIRDLGGAVINKSYLQ